MYIIPLIALILFVALIAFLFYELHKANKVVLAKYNKSPESYHLLMDCFGGYWLMDRE